ncbi:MAG: caspase family protein, partial [Wenzhouxiangellaceae bacterium]
MDPESAEMEGFQAFDDLHVVDCLLPGEVRRMGKTTFLSPRRPVRTTAADCRIRGGEYTAYDRADYRTALQVWMEKARSGDPEAQHYVGEIHEKGMGRAPDYAEAFEWYRRAAEQGYARSQVSLGYFYEQGLGTEPDVAESLKWYRRAAGAGEDELIFASAADERMRELRAELESELEQAQAERRALRQQIERLRAELESERGAGEAARQTVETLEGMLSRVESRAAEAEGRLIRMRGKLEPGIAARPAEPSATTQRMEAGQLNEFRFGKYYALVVGQEGYMFWDPLRSPHHDARRLAEILSLQYGFDTTLLLDASGSEILSSINDLRERVGSGDNVLIYFAGHGQLLRAQTGEQRRGYWLPVNAELERTTYWVSNSAINDYLAILDARSVLVIADSCFGGAMSTDPSSLLLGGAGVLN